MATIRLGNGIADIRGSIGGTTYSRNPTGAYIRNRTKPVNPKSIRQSDIRAIMSLTSASYLDSASAAQRIEWGVFASNVSAKNKVGEDYNMSGYNRFVQSNVAALNAGLPAILDGPIIFTLPGEDINFAVVASAGTQNLTVTYSDGAEWVDENNGALIVEVGIPQNASRNFFDGPWRHAGIVRGNLAVPPTTPGTITSPWPIFENQKIWVQAKIIREDGRTSDWFQVSPIVGA